MKTRLLKFQEFTQSILPLECQFLEENRRFEDPEKNQILNYILNCAKETQQEIAPPNENIDKRKYSYVKNWSLKLLESIDVDNHLEKLMRWEKQIMTDAIESHDEKEILKTLKSSGPAYFNFVKLYELSRHYRHYLQIRMRYRDFATVNSFLNKYRTDYEYCKLINDKLHEATLDIINHYVHKQENSNDWLQWLKSVFYDESVDGFNRILAWIRLVFIAHNRKQYEILTEEFNYFERMVQKGHFYSRRILLNFYSQRLLFYACLGNFETAAHFGYLSIKEANNDYLYYVTNLAAVLLRCNRPEEALSILKSSQKVAKNSLNFHNKIGHTANYLFALNKLGRFRQAENHGFVFLRAYRKEIFEYRWHLFFTAYFQAMLLNANYSPLIKAYQSNKIEAREVSYRSSSNYTPTLPWMLALASYKANAIDFDTLAKNLITLITKSKESYKGNWKKEILETSRKVLKEFWPALEVRLHTGFSK